MIEGHPLPLSAEEMMARAREIAKVDILDLDVREPLARLLDSINRESALHEAGAIAMNARTIRMLVNRLYMLRDFAAHPEIADQEILAPVFVNGLGRTGSTKTQQLLAATDAFNWLCYWQVFNPSSWTGSPNEDCQPRIDDAAAYLEWFDRCSPLTKTGHPFSLLGPEEESYLLDHSFMSPGWVGWSPVPGYLTWWAQQDHRIMFRFLRDMLKYLQWQGIAKPGKRWLLKTPTYTGLEAALFEIFPDATFVMTHRSPSECITSGLKLLEHFHRPFTESKPDVAGYLGGLKAALDKNLAFRDRAGAGQLIDVHLRELIADGPAVVKRVLEGCGIEYSATTDAKVRAWEESDPPHKHGRFAYTAEEYGLTAQSITDYFADYVAFLDRQFPGLKADTEARQKG